MSQTVGFHDGMKRFLQEMQFSMKKKKRFQSLKNSMFPQGHFLNRSLQSWSPFQSKRDSETRRGRGRGGAPGQRPKRIVSLAPCRRDAGPSRHREHILQGTKLFSLTSPGEARRHGVALGGSPRGGGGATKTREDRGQGRGLRVTGCRGKDNNNDDNETSRQAPGSKTSMLALSKNV